MAPAQSKINRAPWTKEQMESAMAAVRDGMPVKSAATLFSIPRRTLRNHLISGKTDRKLGRSSILSPQQEEELCGRLFRLADVGMPITSNVLKRSVYTFCIENGIKTPFSSEKCKAGRRWLELFLARHPDVAKRRTQSLNPGRASKLNKFIVKDYFQKLRKVMLEINVADKPHLIYNIDDITSSATSFC